MANLMITTADGESLEAELYLPETIRAVVVITHPHPQMGGDMYTPVPAGFFNATAGTDTAAIRFNFRGTGRSSGTHDKGVAERLDVAAAVQHATEIAPGVPLHIAGWSFGADVALTLDDERISGWFMAAPPLSVVDPDEMAARTSSGPKILAIGENDKFNPPAKAELTVDQWENTSVHVIEGADHFFGPQLPELITQFKNFVGL